MRRFDTLDFIGERFCQGEVQNLYLVSVSDHHIGRLQNPMDDSLFMCRFQSLGYVAADAQSLPNRQRPSGQSLSQRFTLAKVQDEEAFFIRLFESVNRGDVGMIERCQEFCLAFEAGDPVRILRAGRRELHVRDEQFADFPFSSWNNPHSGIGKSQDHDCSIPFGFLLI